MIYIVLLFHSSSKNVQPYKWYNPPEPPVGMTTSYTAPHLNVHGSTASSGLTTPRKPRVDASEIHQSPVEIGSWNPIIYRVLGHIPGGYFGIFSINIMSVCHIYHRLLWLSQSQWRHSVVKFDHHTWLMHCISPLIVGSLHKNSDSQNFISCLKAQVAMSQDI